jgi:DNA-binding response OmpR family regulator
VTLPHPATPHVERDSQVLVVEDDPDVQQTIRWILEDEGLPVATAADGWQALHLALLRRPALVVVDLNLPRLDGDELIGGLRMADEADIPIVLVSGDQQVAERARELGAFAYLRKPFEMNDLLDVVRRALER